MVTRQGFSGFFDRPRVVQVDIIGSIARVQYQGFVGTVSEVGTMHYLGTLRYQGRLGTIAALGTLDTLRYVRRVGTISGIGTIDTLRYIRRVGTVANLGTLDTARYIRRVGTIEALGTLDTLRYARRVGTISALGSLDTLRYTRRVGTVGNAGTLDTLRYVRRVGTVGALGTVRYIQAGSLGRVARIGTVGRANVTGSIARLGSLMARQTATKRLLGTNQLHVGAGSVVLGSWEDSSPFLTKTYGIVSTMAGSLFVIGGMSGTFLQGLTGTAYKVDLAAGTFAVVSFSEAFQYVRTIVRVGSVGSGKGTLRLQRNFQV